MNKPLTFKVTILQFTLEELKDVYRKHYGYPKTHKVTKKDISLFITIMFESDAESIF